MEKKHWVTTFCVKVLQKQLGRLRKTMENLKQLTRNATFIGSPIQEFHFKSYITNQKDKDP